MEAKLQTVNRTILYNLQTSSGKGLSEHKHISQTKEYELEQREPTQTWDIRSGGAETLAYSVP